MSRVQEKLRSEDTVVVCLKEAGKVYSEPKFRK